MIVITIGIICLLMVFFLMGLFCGANKVFPYYAVRSLSDIVKPSVKASVVEDFEDGKLGVVLFGDSLSARGDWREIKGSEKYELLVVASGGWKANGFPYASDKYAGLIHVFWLGTNDLLSNLDMMGAYDAVSDMAVASAVKGKKIIFIGLPVPLNLSKFTQDAFRKYNEKLGELCMERGWSYLDAEGALNATFAGSADRTHDGVHLTVAASGLMAAELLNMCNRLMECVE